MSQFMWVAFAIVLAVLVDIYIVRVRRRRRMEDEFPGLFANPETPGMYKRAKRYIKTTYQRLVGRLMHSENWQSAIELLLIAAWAIWICRGYFEDFSKLVWPMGREFGVQVYAHHVWLDLLRCGPCALWNGSINGGAPALADPFGSALHPVVMVTTLLFGVVNGGKIAIVISLWLAGLAQWWIAKILAIGRLARLWSAMLVMVAGHLVGRLELGAFGLVLSMTSMSLVLASAFALAKSKTKRSAVLLAFTAALALTSGHGYLQLGMVALVPSFLLLLLDKNLKFTSVWRNYLLALGLCILLAGFFLVPMMHFAPNIAKFTDPVFESAQPLSYIPLNLVIQDWEFMNVQTLGKFPYPYLYNLFIGWWPICLFIFSLYFLRCDKRPILWAMLVAIPVIFFTASGTPFRWLVDMIPFLAGVRHVPLIAGLAVPLILGLAAYSFDELLKLDWPKLVFEIRGNALGIKFFLHWLLLILAVLSIVQVYDFNKAFLKTENAKIVYQAIDVFQSAPLNWIETPFGDHWWVEVALDAGLKITNVVTPWWWKDREKPDPYLMVRPDDNGEGEKLDLLLADMPIYQAAADRYAFMVMDGKISPCEGSGHGGHIDIVCTSDAAGRIIVNENMWSGWKAWEDDTRIPLIGSDRLEVVASAGKHTYHFRYQPWDVILGILFSFAGIGISIYIWRANPPPPKQPRKRPSDPYDP